MHLRGPAWGDAVESAAEETRAAGSGAAGRLLRLNARGAVARRQPGQRGGRPLADLAARGRRSTGESNTCDAVGKGTCTLNSLGEETWC